VDDADPPEDRWMTLAEIAAELRMSPATIRSWVSQGTLQATRAGRRKWLVRRSELDRLLAGRGMWSPDTAGESAPEGGWRERDQIQAPHRSPHWSEEARAGVRPESWLRVTDGEWQLALVESAMAPPDPDFVARIRTIAEASARKAAALANLEEEPGAWCVCRKDRPIYGCRTSCGPPATAPGPQSNGEGSTAPSSSSATRWDITRCQLNSSPSSGSLWSSTRSRTSWWNAASTRGLHRASTSNRKLRTMRPKQLSRTPVRSELQQVVSLLGVESTADLLVKPRAALGANSGHRRGDL